MNSLYRSLSRSNVTRTRRTAASPTVACPVEPLEGRALLSATIAAGGITAPAAAHTITVTYEGLFGIDVNSIGDNDLSVSGPKPVTASFVGAQSENGTVVATYSLAGPGGSWDADDNGSYSISVNPGSVQNLLGGDLPVDGQANLNVAVPAPDTTGPAATISVGGITSAGGATHTISVTYTDPSGVNAGSIDTGDLIVERGGSSLNVSGVSATGSGNTVTATYTIEAPGGSWDSADNGAYAVTLKPSSVQDGAGNGNAAASANFGVNIAAPGDTTAPTAGISAGNLTSAAGSHTITVTFEDDTALDAGSIDAGDLVVTGPGGAALSVTGVQVTPSGNGKGATAVFTVAGPGGGFDSADNGQYAVALKAGGVTDGSGNAATAPAANFSVNIAPAGPVDTTGPAASIAPIAGVTTPGATSLTVVVTYTDDVAIDTGTIDVDDLDIDRQGGGGSNGLAVGGVTTAVSPDGKTVVATYTIVAPGGGFDAGDNGTYVVAVRPSQVRDTSNNQAASTSTTFAVNLSAPGGSDTTPPLATVSVGDVTSAGGATHAITVTYTDDAGMNPDTVGPSDLTVTGPGGGSLNVTDVSKTLSADGRTLTVVYTVAAPGGSFDGSDNGQYAVAVRDNAARDAAGNGSAAASATFRVNTSAAPTDVAAPVVTGISAPNIGAEGVSTVTITVTYSDDAGLDLSSIGTDDLTVAGPAGSLVANVVDVTSSSDGKSATVKYVFAAPNGSFAFADNGTYTISLVGGSVTDASGKGISANATTFLVAVPEPTPIDNGFGGGAPVISDFVAEAVAAGRSGKLLVVGRSAAGAVVEVRNADGSLDTSFNRTGQVVSTTDTAYYAVVAQGDKIVVAGTLGGDLVLTRYNADGRLDASFGNAGRMVVDFGQPNDSAYALAVAPDGKLVAAGQSNGDFAFARFLPDGALDPSFAQGGKQMFDHQGAVDSAGAVVVQPDGKIVIAGSSGDGVVVLRLDVNGEADATFSGDGLLVVSGLRARNDGASAEADRTAALALQADGKILVGNHTAGDDFGVARITATGNVDSSFGNDGLAAADFGGADDADAILVQPTGEILVVGTSLAGSTGSTTLAAFSSSGQLIDGFGQNGKLMLDTGMSSPGRALRVGDLVLRAFGTRQEDGRIVVGTSNSAPSTPPLQSQSALRRLNVPGARNVSAGSQIGTFGTAGTNGKPQRLSYTDADGTVIVFAIKGGTGTLFLGTNGRLNLVLSDGGTGGVTVTARGKGGDGRIAFGDITANGTVKSLNVKNGDLTGTFGAAGSIGKLTLGDVSAASICAAGNVGTIAVNSLSNTKLLAGSSLGADGAFGGTGANADTYGTAAIGSLKVKGQITGSTIGAGLDPVDATFSDEDDRVIGGAASFIKAISAKSADDTSRFISGSFGKVKLGSKVDAGTDARFRVLQ